ncbi:hypothetical protein MLD38_030349 [Melastoma candidum]|uniref:Uncharacterized protein n=1 Tax=Melastoma candidum TaxID=119954 RepID=A0ACB9MLG6_9MYRT|nr:hypothetical protein MLD38_030349 [Melastoma candidum]
MLPVSDRLSSPEHHHKKTAAAAAATAPSKELLLHNRKTSFGSLTGSPHSPYSFSLGQHRGGRTFLFLVFISLQIVLFFSARSLPFSLSSNHGNRRFSSADASTDALASSFAAAGLRASSKHDNCDSGTIHTLRDVHGCGEVLQISRWLNLGN